YFKPLEFEGFKKQAGANAFTMSPKKWIEATDAIGIVSKAGRYGGTYAHSDIAMSFATWISPEFQLYIMKDYRRLKTDENSRLSMNWNLNREISKLNYRIHTDAIKDNLIPPENLESYNAVLISQGKNQKERVELLRQLAVQQLQTLENVSFNNLPKIEKEK